MARKFSSCDTNRVRRLVAESTNPRFKCFHDSLPGEDKPCVDGCLFVKSFCECCGQEIRWCRKCWFWEFGRTESKSSPIRKEDKFSRLEDSSNCDNKKWIFVGLSTLLVLGIYVFLTSDKKSPTIEELKEKFPSQKKETWYHILSALEMEMPTVKSITLLHGDDKKTLPCLTRLLVEKFSSDKNFKIEEIQFKTIPGLNDYGQVLEHYLPLVRKHKVLLTHLNDVPANISRIFHSLCDDISSDIKPSLFIFTLKCDNYDQDLKPIERASSTLKEAWGELAENDFFPLLSRVLRNVVDVVPEKMVNC